MHEKLELLRGRKFVVERNQHTPAEENCISRNQPFRLIGHDNRSAGGALKIGVLQGSRKRQGCLFELTVSKSRVLAFAVCLDQANLLRPALQSRAQSFA